MGRMKESEACGFYVVFLKLKTKLDYGNIVLIY